MQKHAARIRKSTCTKYSARTPTAMPINADNADDNDAYARLSTSG